MSHEVPTHRFDEATVAAVVSHMNADHADDTLLICRILGDRPRAESAEMVGLDGAGADYRVRSAASDELIRIPWSRPLTERAEIRVEVVRLHEAACAAAGVDRDQLRGGDGRDR